jgi:GH24 family phage-related lysozyme (muramidase)
MGSLHHKLNKDKTMDEAIQSFTPVPPSGQRASVGRVPVLPTDETFNTVVGFAQKLNMSSIQKARAEQYVEGQMEAAQQDGVAEVRKNSPWVAKLFGGGAALSGAMDYMEKTRLLEYQDAINKDMSNLRTLRPEDFKQKQLDDINQFMTDDDETNARIMQSFERALPTVARAQAKAHEAFVQENHLTKMTTFINKSLDATETSRATGDADDIQAASAQMYDGLQRQPGMNKEAYKNALYNSLAHASATGDTLVAQKIIDAGFVTSPDDVDKLDKAEAGLEKYKADQATFAFGESQHNMTVLAEDMSISDTEYTSVLFKEYNKEGNAYTAEKIASLLNRRITAKEKAAKATDWQHNVELVSQGAVNRIPDKDRQKTFELFDQQIANSETPEDQARGIRNFMNGLTGTSTTSEATTERWRAGLAKPVILDENGLIQVSTTAAATMDELDTWYQMSQDQESDVLSRHTDSYTAGLYAAYRAARIADPGASPAMLMQTAVDANKPVEGGGTSKAFATPDAQAATQERITDFNTFNDDSFLNTNFSGDFASAAKLFSGFPQPVKDAKINAYLNDRWEVSDDSVIPKVGSQSVEQRVGVTKPLWRVKQMARMNPKASGQDVSVGLIGTRRAVGVYNTSGELLYQVPFEDIAAHANMGKKAELVGKTTATHKAAYESLMKDAERALVTRAQIDLNNLEPGYGAGQRFDRTRSSDYVQESVASMSDLEKLAAYKLIRDEEGGNLEAIGKWIAESPLGSPENQGSTEYRPIGEYIGKLLGFNKQQKDKELQLAQEYIESNLPAQDTQLTSVVQDAVMAMGVYNGKAAIKAVEEAEGQLTTEQKVVVRYEGFATGKYDDIKGVETVGVGQTGVYKGKSFKQVFEIHKDRARDAIPSLDDLPEPIRAELIAATYRGDVKQSYKWVQAFNEGRFEDAASELFNNNELQGYLNARNEGNATAGGNIPERFDSLQRAILGMIRS